MTELIEIEFFPIRYVFIVNQITVLHKYGAFHSISFSAQPKKDIFFASEINLNIDGNINLFDSRYGKSWSL